MAWGYDDMMGMMGYNWLGLGMLGMVFWLFFWLLVIYLVFRLVCGKACCGIGFGNGKTAQEILKERYAKGEISKKEFDRMKKDLA